MNLLVNKRPNKVISLVNENLLLGKLVFLPTSRFVTLAATAKFQNENENETNRNRIATSYKVGLLYNSSSDK